MKNLFTLGLILFTVALFAQDKVITKNGNINFEASVPAFEEIKAKNENVTCILNTKTGEIASLALIKGFRFKIALMEEHFNENYMESDKYPKATFKGTIINFDLSKLTTTYTEYTVKGKLEIHGKSKDISSLAKIRKTDKGIDLITNFDVYASDFAIEIPSVVKNKVSNKILISNSFLLK